MDLADYGVGESRYRDHQLPKKQETLNRWHGQGLESSQERGRRPSLFLHLMFIIPSIFAYVKGAINYANRYLTYQSSSLGHFYCRSDPRNQKVGDNMAKPMSFRFPDDFATYLRTWAFVTEKEQRELLVEAFNEYADRHPEIKKKVEKIIETMKNDSEK